MDRLNPDTLEHLAEALRTAAEAGHSILLGGAFTKNRMGGRLAHADVCISTSALDRVRQYEPNDLTVSVEAGMRWADLRKMLEENRQMIPLDPPFAAEATVGGVVIANTPGPRRRLYGSPRDHVIGMELATLEGNVVQTGGMVVKNVAGLDIGKLMIGSFGTLAAVGVINFKVTPMPACSRTFLLRGESLDEAMTARDQLLKGVLQPAALDYLNPHAAARLGLEGHLLMVQAVGTEAVVDRYARDLPGWQIVEGSHEEYLWERVREFTPRFLNEHEQGTVARLSVTLADVGAVARIAPVPLVARAGNGVCYAYLPDLETGAPWLKNAVARGWRGVLEFVPPQHCGPALQWPSPGDDFTVMEKVKQMFDPNRLLNKGRLYGRI